MLRKYCLRVILALTGALLGVGLLFLADLLLSRAFSKNNNNRSAARSLITYEGGYYKQPPEDDEILGYKPRANSKLHSVKKMAGKIVYDVNYTIDGYGRRVTPLTDDKNRKKFILFFVCSNIFGEGVDDNQTLPYYVSQLLTSYKPYNCGFCGYGPCQMLAKLQNDSILKEVEEREGILVYLFIDHHVERVAGLTTSWNKKLPYYAIDKKGNLVFKGRFCYAPPSYIIWLWRSRLFWQTIKLRDMIGRSIGIDFYKQTQIKEKDILLTARIIEEAKNTFKNKFGNKNEFYVLFYPGSKYAEKMIPYLRNAGVRCLDYHMFLKYTSDDYKIKGDGHPNAKAYKELSVMISSDILNTTKNR